MPNHNAKVFKRQPAPLESWKWHDHPIVLGGNLIRFWGASGKNTFNDLKFGHSSIIELPKHLPSMFYFVEYKCYKGNFSLVFPYEKLFLPLLLDFDFHKSSTKMQRAKNRYGKQFFWKRDGISGGGLVLIWRENIFIFMFQMGRNKC